MKVNIGLILLSLAVVAAPVVWHLAARQFGLEEVDRVAQLEAEIVELRETLAAADGRLEQLSARVDGLDSRTARRVLDQAFHQDQTPPPPETSDTLKDAFAQVVLIADRRNVNDGMTLAGSSFLMEFLGPPREILSDECEPMENEQLSGMLSLEDVGPIRVHMLRPAVISLRQVFRNVEVYEPELYARIRSAGSLCVRRIRGAETAASAHAYGLAVDLNIDGELDTLGDGKTQLGLTILAEFFRQEGWIWGAGFGREDSMHFEVSREKLEQWRRLGQI